MTIANFKGSEINYDNHADTTCKIHNNWTKIEGSRRSGSHALQKHIVKWAKLPNCNTLLETLQKWFKPIGWFGEKKKEIPFDYVYYFPFDQFAFNQRVHKLWQPIIGRILIEL